jgi:hypothetical protein
VGRASKEGGRACPGVPQDSPDHTVQTPAMAMPTLLGLEALPSAKPGNELHTYVQRGTESFSYAYTCSDCVGNLCVWCQ